jgi:hypothetical protein
MAPIYDMLTSTKLLYAILEMVMITHMVSSNYIVFLNNTACLVQDQSIENVTRQKYFYRYRYFLPTDFKEDGGKFTTTSELLSEFMIINFNFMKVHVYLSQKILVSNAQIPPKTGDELRHFGRVNSCCSISGTCHVTLVTNPVIRHE